LAPVAEQFWSGFAQKAHKKVFKSWKLYQEYAAKPVDRNGMSIKRGFICCITFLGFMNFDDFKLHKTRENNATFITPHLIQG
jgi:hypothetical protein